MQQWWKERWDNGEKFKEGKQEEGLKAGESLSALFGTCTDSRFLARGRDAASLPASYVRHTIFWSCVFELLTSLPLGTSHKAHHLLYIMQVPLIRLQCGVNSYDWGKHGKESAAAKFAAATHNDFSIQEGKPYAEVCFGSFNLKSTDSSS